MLNRYSKIFSSSSGSSPDLYEFLYSSAVEDSKCKDDSLCFSKLKGLTEKTKSSIGASSSKTPSKSGFSGNDLSKAGLTTEDVDALIEEFDSESEDVAETVKARPRKRLEPSQEISSSCLDLIEDSLLKDSTSKKKSNSIADKMPQNKTPLKANEHVDSPAGSSSGFAETGETRPRIRLEPSHESNTSCLDLIEESLLKESTSKKNSVSLDKTRHNTTPAKTNVQSDSIAGSLSGSTKVEKLDLCGSPEKTAASDQKEIVSSSSLGKIKESRREENVSSYPPEKKAESKRDVALCSSGMDPEFPKDKIVVSDSQKFSTPEEQTKSDVSRSSQKSRSSAPKRKISDYFSPTT